MPAHRLWMKSGTSGRAIYFNHSSVHQHENDDAQRLHGEPDDRGLEPQPKERPQIHPLQRGLEVVQHIRRNRRGALYQPGRTGNHALRHVKDGHHDIERVGKYQHRTRGLEHPFIEVRHVHFQCVLSSRFFI